MGQKYVVIVILFAWVYLLFETPLSAQNISLEQAGSPFAEEGGTASIIARTDLIDNVNDIIVNIDFSGDAVVGTDFSTEANFITISAGNETGSITLTGLTDNIYEGSETLTATITSVSGGTASTGSPDFISLDIYDDEDLPEVTILASPTTVGEDVGTVDLTVELSNPSAQTITLDLGVTEGTVVAEDYNFPNNQVTFTSPSISEITSIEITDDLIYELSETLTVGISDVSAGEINSGATSPLTLTIEDNEAIPEVNLPTTTASIEEDQSINITGTISPATYEEVTISLSVNNGTASDDDYTFSDQVVSIPAGETQFQFSIAAVDDLLSEPTETFSVEITGIENGVATEGPNTVQNMEIIDINGPPSISMAASAPSILEGGGTSTITVSVDPPSSEIVTVNIGASGGTASTSDYTLSATNISFDPEETSQEVILTGRDDNIYEDTETLTIELSDPTGGGAIIGSPGTLDFEITDDESAPQITLSADPTTFMEGSGTTITVSLSAEDTEEVSVTLDTTNGTASEGDYSFTNDPVVFAAGETEQTVTISAISDGISEPDETFSIGITDVNGGSAYYNSPEAEELTITDNDGTPTISMTASDASFSENAGTSTITVSVNPPSSEVIAVNIGPSGGTASGSDYSLSTNMISFAANQASQTVTLTGTDDNIYEGTETLSLQLSDPTGGGAVIGTPNVLDFEIIDDESIPELSLSASENSFAENASTTITATLSNPSTQDIVVHLQVNNQNAEPEDYTVSANPVTIEAGNTTATTIISGVEDNFYEGNEHLNVSISHTSGGSVDTGSNTPLTLTITDNQTPPLVSLSTSTSGITEGGSSTVTATLSNPTFEDVTVSLSYSGDATRGEDYSLSSTNIVIPAFSSSASITLSGIDDNIYETTENIYVSISAVSGGSASENGTQQQTIVLSDNDSAPLVTLSASPLSISENGNTTLTIALSNPTFENVLVNLEASTSDASENDYILSATSVTIPAGSENATTTLEGIPDNIFEGDEAVVVSISGTGGGGASIDNPHEVTITIEDAQNIPTVSLSFTGTPFSENGGTASLIAQLSHASYQTVTVNLAYSGTASASDYSGEQAQIVIPTGNLSQSISIAGVNDLTAEGDETIVVTISSVENAIENGIQEVSATILDDDVPGIRPTIFDANTITSENGLSDSFTIQLNTQPSSNVVVEITGLDNSEGALSTTEITFTPQNWNEAQLITITGVDDNEVDGNITYTLTLTVDDTQSDAAYHGIETTVEVTNNDNDSAGFDLNITNSHTQTNESGTRDVFTVVLLSQPTSNVVFAISGLDETEGALSSSELTFTSQNWNTQQTVTITGVDDDEVDGNINYTLTVAVVDEQSDATYHGQSETLLVTNIDDDLAGLVVSTTNETLTTDETGTSSSFEVSLSSRPASEVVISISGLDTSEGSLDKEQLIFTTDSWSQPQTVTLTGQDDFLVDGDISFTLLLTVENSLSSPDYHDLTSELSATNTDDDEAAIVITLTNDEIRTSENGDSDSFTIRLNSQPLSQVVINISGIDASEGTLSTNELIFSDENWDTEQTVTVTGVDDEIVDGNIQYTLTLTVDSDNSDGSYRDISSLIEVLNADNDEEVSNHAPQPGDDAYEMLRYDTLEGSSLLNNDIDPDNDSFIIETTPTIFPQNGTITIFNNGTFIYRPNPEFTGIDSFEYGICDNGNPTLCATATVTITVNDRFMDPAGDTDGDGIPDMTEGDGDCNNDGYPDWIDPDGCYEEFQVTQGFSPNGDGHNDELTLGAFKDYDRVGIVIFSRWGEIVYENNHFRNGDSWDGTASSGFNKGEKVPSGTYYYVITIYDINKKVNGYFYIAK
ncbi:Calx-beta domain-containing protein [Marinilabilia salmonicolor]|uniref:Calx-beta domain-containing protein n=1 Tax=Marinilabilia salmonicolor TaxID=989 RepID=UPI00029A3CEA|nr:Calx-beta domain-containing protein [Marinilabilia salmonicolor]